MKPVNVVLVLADDLSVDALGCYGNKESYTPWLDRLAEQGLVMDNFLCASPVCSPARASLLTGTMPSYHGVHDWIASGNCGENRIQYLDGCTAYTELLQKAGYCCGLSGKWHLGASDVPQKGFSHWYAYPGGGGSYKDPDMLRGNKRVSEKGYLTDLITQDALSFLDRAAHGGQPFYLSVHYTAPHHPWIDNHPQIYLDLYERCPFSNCPQEKLPAWLTAGPLTSRTQKELRENLKGYFAAVSAMDHGVGEIMQRLESLDLQDNTLVCFMSDNGFSCGKHGFWGKGNATSPFNMFESSVKVPAVFSQPGRITPGRYEGLLSACDFFPTLLEYLQLLPYREERPGHSFAAVLNGDRQVTEERLVCLCNEYGNVRMIRTAQWKYVHRYPYGPHELYDLQVDPKEENNLSGQEKFKETVEQLRGCMERWFARFSCVENDGLRENVSGNGQIARSGLAGGGKNAFAP